MEENPGRPENGSSDGPPRRPSLTERLMSPPRPAMATPETATDASEQRDSLTAEPPTPKRPSALRSAAPSFTLAASPAESQSMTEARRLIRVRYFAFLASMSVLFVTMVVAVIALAVFALNDGRWEEKAASGAIAGGTLLLLVLLQYRPVSGYATAASEMAQLEALSTHLQKSYALWDGFLENRGNVQQVGANDVALAVSSMTATTREMVALQTELLRTRRGATGSTSSTQLGAFPTPTSPDPRRY
jgi:hypothetical protein